MILDLVVLLLLIKLDMCNGLILGLLITDFVIHFLLGTINLIIKIYNFVEDNC